jgi:D-sedoheptulose 7-phosphate isomerase
VHDARRLVASNIEESIRVGRDVLDGHVEQIALIAERVTEALGGGNKLLLVGNGGSAADAQHVAAELVGRLELERKALPAIALTTDTSVLTSLANDSGVESLFARQIEALADPGDVVLALSTSGRSPNVLAGVAAAREVGAFTIGLTGADGAELAAACDLALLVPSTRTMRVQEMHMLVCHAVCESVERALAG